MGSQDDEKSLYVGPAAVFTAAVKAYLLNNIGLLCDVNKNWARIHQETGLERWQLKYWLALMDELTKQNPKRTDEKFRKIQLAAEASDEEAKREDEFALIECRLEEERLCLSTLD